MCVCVCECMLAYVCMCVHGWAGIILLVSHAACAMYVCIIIESANIRTPLTQVQGGEDP